MAAPTTTTADDARELLAARRQDQQAFERIVAPHRPGLLAHCYRMLGSAQDAEDALQDALIGAWRGIARFEARSSLKTWLYKIATNVCLRAIERRPTLILPGALGSAARPHDELEPPPAERVWLEPFPDDAVGLPDGMASPEARYEQREAVELAFVAAMQHLPARQRAVLLLRDVLGFAPAEIAGVLGATPAAVSSALQRAHRTVDELLPQRSQQATLRELGDDALKELVGRYVAAWETGNVDLIVDLLAQDAIYAMPPTPTWYRGRADIREFLLLRPLAQSRRWRLLPAVANGQQAFAFYSAVEGSSTAFRAYAIDVATLNSAGEFAALRAFRDPEFTDPATFGRFGLPLQLTD